MRITSLFGPCIKQTEKAMKEIAGLKSVYSDTKGAYVRGKNAAEYRHYTGVRKAKYIGKVTYKKGIKQHLPGIFACILSPLPCGSIGGYGLGKLFQRII